MIMQVVNSLAIYLSIMDLEVKPKVVTTKMLTIMHHYIRKVKQFGWTTVNQVINLYTAIMFTVASLSNILTNLANLGFCLNLIN